VSSSPPSPYPSPVKERENLQKELRVMGEIFVLVEHRQGKIRDITYEMLAVGRKLASQQGISSTRCSAGTQC